MPDNGMGQMIQLLSTISEMQSKKKELSLREEELKQRAMDTAHAFGIQEKSDQFKNFQAFMALASDVPTEARSKLGEAANKAFGNSQEGQSFAQAITALAMSAPESLKLLQARKAAEGASQVNPGEVASSALTGQNLGGQAISAMQQRLNNPATITPQMQTDNSQFMANRQDPLTAILQHSIANNPDLRGRMANVMSGGMTPYQSSEIDVRNREAATGEAGVRQAGLSGEMSIAKDLIIAGMSKGKSAQQQAANMRILQAQLKMAQDKNKNPAQRMQDMAIYNMMADQFQMPQYKLKSADDNDPTTLLEQGLRTLAPYESQGPGQQSPIAPFVGPPPFSFSPPAGPRP